MEKSQDFSQSSALDMILYICSPGFSHLFIVRQTWFEYDGCDPASQIPNWIKGSFWSWLDEFDLAVAGQLRRYSLLWVTIS
jgi:hypothetical protein